MPYSGMRACCRNGRHEGDAVVDDEHQRKARMASKHDMIPMRGFSQSLPMALLRARAAVMRRFRPGLRSRGVTEQQWRILRALAHSGPLEVTALAASTFLLAPSLSRILPELESRGYISRRQLDSDLRRAVVCLEPKGLQLIAAHAPDSEGVYDAIARSFGQERLEQLFKLLRELEETLAAETASAARSRSHSPGHG
jgi:homoprotocatechuate degradation regulator HpaR